MPPKGDPLTAKEVRVLSAWIDGGLPWEPGFTFKPRGLRGPAQAAAGGPAAGGPRPRPPDRPHRRRLLRREQASRPRRRSTTRRSPAGSYFDLIGLLPAPAEAGRLPRRRGRRTSGRRLVRRLLADDRPYADHWLTFWNDLLRNDYKGTGYIDGGRKQITAWLYQSLLENKPYDRFARELISPTPESEGFIKGIKWRGRVNASQVVGAPVRAERRAGVLRREHEVRLVPRQLHRPLEARRRLRPGRGDRRQAAGDPPLRQADRARRRRRSSSSPSWARSTPAAPEGQAAGAAGGAGDAPGQRPVHPHHRQPPLAAAHGPRDRPPGRRDGATSPGARTCSTTSPSTSPTTATT